MTMGTDHNPSSSSVPTVDTSTVGAFLAEQRRIIGQRVMDGATGAETMAAMTELVDGLIIGRYGMPCGRAETRWHQPASTSAAWWPWEDTVAGNWLPIRTSISCFSSVPRRSCKSNRSCVPCLHPLWDCGFQVGHSVRTIHDCIELAAADPTVKTSMMESRFLAGSAELFEQFHGRYMRKVVVKNPDTYLDQKLEERRREYLKFGETVYLLEPNVKKSQGGLRDLHLLQWAGMARYQAPTIRELSDRGILSRADSIALTEARDFLWRVRALLHVHAGTAQEILSFDEQIWLAATFRVSGPTALVGRRAIHATVLPAHDGIARTLHAICRTLSERPVLATDRPVVAGSPRRSNIFVVRGGVW